MPYKDKEKNREYNRQRHKNRKAIGLCASCNQPRFKNSVRCLLHLDRQKRRVRELYRSNLQVNERVKAYYHARYYKLKSENKCIRCGTPLDEESRMGLQCVNCYTAQEYGIMKGVL